MREYRAALMVAVPAALSILGLLWMLRRGRGIRSGGKRDKEKDGDEPQREESQHDQVTIGQRKIPECLARDRGDSDLDPLRARLGDMVNSAVGRGVEEGAALAKVKASSSESCVVSSTQRNTQARACRSETYQQNAGQVEVSSSEARILPLSAAATNQDKASSSETKISEAKASSVEDNQDKLSHPDAKTSTSDSEDSQLKASEAKISSSETKVLCSEVKSSESSKDQICSVVPQSCDVAMIENASAPLQHSEASAESFQRESSTVASKDSVSDSQPCAVHESDKDVKSECETSKSIPSTEGDINIESGVDESCKTVSSTSVAEVDNEMSESRKVISSGYSSQTEVSTEGEVVSTTDPSVSSEKSSECVCPSSADKEADKVDAPAQSVSPVGDTHSEGSNDSGRGCSDQENNRSNTQADDALVHYDFNMPSELCGRFIGKQGKNINFLKSKTGASVSLVNNPFTAQFQICQVVGSQSEVDDALCMIRHKFPVSEYPHLTMQAINVNPNPEQPVVVPDGMQLSLPEGVSVEVFVSAIVDAGRVFVQQPTHRSFMSLEKLGFFLGTVYGQDPNIPCLPTPVECGVICVCETEGAWYRAMVTSSENEAGQCQVKFVDYGGFALLPVTSLKQIRTDFMTLPFQAVECLMANITPLQGESAFNEEAGMSLLSMTDGKLLQCQVVARSESGQPYIHLYQVDAQNNTAVMINRALVNNCSVRWIEILQQPPQDPSPTPASG